MGSLAARLVVSRELDVVADNVLTIAASARVIFTDPPDTATEVVIRIVEIMKRRGRKRVQRQFGRFLGHFSGGRFVVDQMFGAPLNHGRPNPVHVVAGEGSGRATMTGHAPPARDVESHTLALSIEAAGFSPFNGEHRMHVGIPGAAIVFTENRHDGAALRGYSTPLAESVAARRLTQSGQVANGPWGFSNKASVVNQVKAFHDKTGVRVAEIQVVGHTNNGLDFASPKESEELAKHATADVKIVWHGCYACNFFSEIRQAAFFKNLPLATVYGHRDIMVQAGMPWGFVRFRKAGEDDLDAVIGEVVPMSYVIKWASNEPEEHLLKTLKADEAEADVKAVVRKELAARGRAP